MVDFIELSPKISGKYWRLVNRPLRDGWVCLDSELERRVERGLPV